MKRIQELNDVSRGIVKGMSMISMKDGLNNREVQFHIRKHDESL
mgnify:CR=1 FL=1